MTRIGPGACRLARFEPLDARSAGNPATSQAPLALSLYSFVESLKRVFVRPVKTACFEVIDSFPKPGVQVSIYQAPAQSDPSGPDLRLDEVAFLDSGGVADFLWNNDPEPWTNPGGGASHNRIVVPLWEKWE